METPLVHATSLHQQVASPLPPMEALDLAEFDVVDLQSEVAKDNKSKIEQPSAPAPSPDLPKPEDGFRFSDLDLVSEALVLTSYARFKGLVKKDTSEQWEEVNGLDQLEVGCGYRTENSIPIRRLSRDELLIGGKIRMLMESLPPGSASPARARYMATLRGYFDRSTGVIALEALSQMKFENGIPLAHYNREGPSDKCLRVHSFDKIKIGIAYMVAYTDGLLKFKRISQGEIYIHYKRRREMLVVRSQEIKTGKLEAIKYKKRTPLADATNMENVVMQFPAGGKGRHGRSPSKRRSSMGPSTKPAADKKKTNGNGFGIFRYLFSARSASPSSPSSPRRSPNRRKSMGAALISTNGRMDLQAPPPPPPPAPAPPPPPPFATPAPPPPGGLRGKRGLASQTGTGLTSTTPRKKMRSLYWSVIPKDKLQQTVWCSQEVLSSPSINVDVSRLESLFSLSPDKRTNKFTTKSGKEAKQSPLVAILTLPRLNNIAILLSRFKITEEEIKQAIISMDDTVLTAENVNALLYITPKDEEIRALRTFKEKLDPTVPLGKVERFIFAMIEIPRLEKRLELFQWKLQMEPTVADLRKSILSLATACDEVKTSKRLPVLLKAVLVIGQVLNRDSHLFHSDGFRIESLMKLTDTKGKDNLTTLDYLVNEIEEKMEDLLSFSEDIPSTEAAAKVQMDHLTAELNKMRSFLTQMQHELKIVSLQQHQATVGSLGGEAGEQKRRMFEAYGEVITALYDRAAAQVKEVSDAMDEATAKWKELAMFYGEDGDKMQPQQFFGIMHSFAQQFNTAHAESIKRKERAEKERLRKEKEERARQAKEERARQKQLEAEEKERLKQQELEQEAAQHKSDDLLAPTDEEAERAEDQEREECEEDKGECPDEEIQPREEEMGSETDGEEQRKEKDEEEKEEEEAAVLELQEETESETDATDVSKNMEEKEEEEAAVLELQEETESETDVSKDGEEEEIGDAEAASAGNSVLVESTSNEHVLRL